MRIGVVMGGVSSEREVSLNTGREIMNNLDKTKYTIEPIIIDSKKDLIEKTKGIDMALLALHGTFGEDGTVQGVLETLDIPYTGCGVLSSALCMDKDMTKKILKLDGINTGKWIIARSTDDIDFTELKDIGYPVVVKPNSGGSSVATRIVDSPEGVRGAVEEALKYDREVMIEEYIRGDEITCPILKGKMLPILAIKPKSSFFDYTSKYEDGGAEEFVIEFEGEMQRKIEDMAIRCYELLKCSVYARVDMIIKDGVPYVLEINTLPGMTKNSLMPKSARAVGISFTQLLDLIIEHSSSERAYK